MRLSRVLLAAAALLTVSGGIGGGLFVTQPWVGPGTSPYIVVGDRAAVAAQALDVEPTFTYRHAVQGFAADLTDDEADLLRQSRNVRLEPDALVEILEGSPTGIRRILAGDSGFTGEGVTVAILDTGIDPHPELEIAAGLSRDFTGKGSWRDGHGHGTHVAGIVAGNTVGVAPDAQVAAVKVLTDSGTGNISNLIAGLDWVMQHSASINVVNMSLGAILTDNSSCTNPKYPATAFHEAICSVVGAGVTVVVAAGNNAGSASGMVPCNYVETICVSAIADSDGLPGHLGPDTSRGSDDTLAPFSNKGPVIDIAAPGVDIVSTCPGDNMCVKSGTSMASPHVAGTVAQILEATPGLDPVAVRARLYEFAAAQTSEWGFSGDTDGAANWPCGRTGCWREPLVMAGAGEPIPTPSPTATPVPTRTPLPTPPSASPTPTAVMPSPTPAPSELDRLRALICEAIDILYPGWGPCSE